MKAVVLLDGDGFDVRELHSGGTDFKKKVIERWIGANPADQDKLSAIRQLAAPNAPAFVFHAVKTKVDSKDQAEAMAAAIRANGERAEVRLVGPSRWKSNETFIGAPANENNAELLRFLKEAVR